MFNTIFWEPRYGHKILVRNLKPYSIFLRSSTRLHFKKYNICISKFTCIRILSVPGILHFWFFVHFQTFSKLIFNAIEGEGNLAALQCPHILPGVLVILSYCHIVILGVSVASTVHTMSPAASLYSHFQNIYTRSIFAQWKPSVKNPNTQKCQISSNILMSRALLFRQSP